MIELQQLSKHFGDFIAVDNVSFSVEPGEVLGFLGPNGAGKSTTMKMAAGFLTPTQGQATLFGHNIHQQPVKAKQLLGYLPEGAPSYADMTVTAFLRFIADVRGYRGLEARTRVDYAVEQLGLQRVLLQPIETLSKGFKRRVGFAQAILHDPKVLILDEPTDGLDPNQKHQVRQLINQLAQDKIIIISTHILEEVSAVCTRTAVIAAGRLVANSTPSELIARSRYHGAVSLSLPQAETASSILQALPSVAAVEQEAQRLTLLPNPEATILPELLACLQQQAWEVTDVTVEQGRLDDVFRSLTEGVAA